ncbi:MAG: hypothetical protein LBH80_06395, partial [Prevotellaceae bacterium]|nr:hypothetical protein [Prevotellaceae bacterium]
MAEAERQEVLQSIEGLNLIKMRSKNKLPDGRKKAENIKRQLPSKERVGNLWICRSADLCWDDFKQPHGSVIYGRAA